jgi:hypothetical protein
MQKINAIRGCRARDAFRNLYTSFSKAHAKIIIKGNYDSNQGLFLQALRSIITLFFFPKNMTARIPQLKYIIVVGAQFGNQLLEKGGNFSYTCARLKREKSDWNCF